MPPVDISNFLRQTEMERAELGRSAASASPGTCLMLGTSFEQNEGDDWPLSGAGSGQPNTLANQLGVVRWASWLNGDTLRIIKNVALSGQTSATIFANIANPGSAQYALGLNPAPGFIYLGHVTGDDTGILTAAQSAANDLAIYNLLRAAYPYAVIILPTLPGVNIGGGNAQTRATVNPQRRALALVNPNTLLFDYEGLFTDPTTGLPVAAWSQDAVHPNPTFGLIGGRALGALLARLLPTKSFVNDYTNDARVSAANGGWTIDALMRGTPGANTTATNWTFAGPAGATRALVARADQYGNIQKMTYGGTAGPLKISRTFPAVFPQGAQIQLEFEFIFFGTLPASGVTDISAGIILGNASFATIASAAAVGTTLKNQGNYLDPGAGVTLSARTPPLTVPAGMSTASSIALLQADGTATAGDLGISRVSVIRLA